MCPGQKPDLWSNFSDRSGVSTINTFPILYNVFPYKFILQVSKESRDLTGTLFELRKERSHDHSKTINRDAAQRTSGTGGFALLGETAVPVLHDLNSAVGREYYGIADKDMAGVQVLALRVQDGDQASCLNLSRAQKPRLLGVNPERLRGRFTFVRGAEGGGRERGWELLRANARDGSGIVGRPDEVPVVGDANSPLPVLDSTRLLARAALRRAVSEAP